MASDFRMKRLRTLRSTRLQILIGMATEPAKTKLSLMAREQMRESIFREDPALKSIMQLYLEAN